MAEWIPRHSKWDTKDLHLDKALRVFFMNECPEDWTYSTDRIYRAFIIETASGPRGWKNCFSIGSELNDSQIRVKYQRKFMHDFLIVIIIYSLPGEPEGSWSAIGNAAKYIPTCKPTMVLDFTGMTDREIKATVIHQFGHALGLGHALMNINDWSHVKEFINVDKMVENYGLKSQDNFEVQWSGHKSQQSIINYDNESVMSYR